MCINLLYAAGAHPENYIWKTPDVKQRVEQDMHVILDLQPGMKGLYKLCRRQIRRHLLSQDGGNYNNLFMVIPKLPLPHIVKDFLLYGVDINEALPKLQGEAEAAVLEQMRKEE